MNRVFSRNCRIAPFALALVLALVPRGASGQTVSSGIRGRVLDTEGKPAAGATVRILGVETGAERVAESGEDGSYSILFLPPGLYDIRAELGSARSPEGLTVELPLQQTVEMDLRINALVEGAVSVAARVRVDPTITATQSRVDRKTIEALPLNGRRFTDLALLDSRSRPAPVGTYFGEAAQVLTFNGQGGRSNAYLVDGVSNNDATLGTNGNAPFSQLAIQEFQVVSDGYGPEFGGASGGILNVVSRGGTNRTTLEAFVQGTSPSWNSPDPLADVVEGEYEEDSLERWQGGLALSGPVVKDRTFYFFSLERTEEKPIHAFTGVTRDGARGGLFRGDDDRTNLFFRADHALANGSTLMVRALYGDGHTDGLNVIGNDTPEAGHELDDHDREIAVTWKNLLDARRFNEVRFHISDSRRWQSANSSRPGTDRPSGVYGGNHLQGQINEERHISLVENYSWQSGRHLWKVGGAVDLVDVRQQVSFNPNGLFLYDTDRPFEPGDNGFGRIGVPGVDDDGDGTVDELPDPSTYAIVYQRIDGEPDVDIPDQRYGLFLQDEWEVHPDLRMTWGFRYDLSTFELGEQYSVPSSIPNGGAPRDHDNIAPRLSLSWMPRGTDRTVVRFGAGLFYDKIILGFPAIAAVTSGQTLRLGFPQPLQIPVDEAFVEKYGPGALDPILFDLPSLALYFSTGTVLDTPYSRQVHLGVEKALGDAYSIGADIADARGYHIPLFVDLNPVVGTLPPPNPPLPAHQDPEIGSIAAISTLGNTWYRAAQVTFRKVQGALQGSFSYTFSRSEDQGSDPLLGGVSLPPDPNDIEGERARADGDRAHRLVLTGALQLPKRFRLTSLLTWSTGTPFNVLSGEDTNMDGLLNDRPPGIDRNTGEDTSVDRINSARADYRSRNGLAYDALPDFSGKLEEPDFFQWDLRVGRQFGFGKRGSQGELFLQVFNVTDEDNLGLVDGNILSPHFGEPRAVVGPPRTFEVGATVRF